MHKQYIKHVDLKQTKEHFRDEQINKQVSEHKKQISKDYDTIRNLVMENKHEQQKKNNKINII